MSFGTFSPESSSTQNLNYTPQSATGNGVNLRTGANGTLGNRNAGNIRLGRGATLTLNEGLGADALAGLSAGITQNIK